MSINNYGEMYINAVNYGVGADALDETKPATEAQEALTPEENEAYGNFTNPITADIPVGISIDDLESAINQAKQEGQDYVTLDDLDLDKLKEADSSDEIIKYPNINKIPEEIKIESDDEGAEAKLGKVEKAYIETLVEGNNELNSIKEDLTESLKNAGYSDEEIEEQVENAEKKYLENNKEYSEAKQKLGDIQKTHDEYMAKEFEKWQKENPAPDYTTATKEELDEYQQKVFEFKEKTETEYGKENPQYAYYKEVQQNIKNQDALEALKEQINEAKQKIGKFFGDGTIKGNSAEDIKEAILKLFDNDDLKTYENESSSDLKEAISYLTNDYSNEAKSLNLNDNQSSIYKS